MQYLTDKEIKERITILGEPDFTRIANEYYSMESIANAIAKSGKAESFARLYFNGNQEAVNAIIAYKDNPTACECVIKDIFMTLMYHPDDADIVAKALSQEKVKNLVSRLKDGDLAAAMKCLGIAARYIKDRNANAGYLAKIAESASAQIGQGFKKYMEAIEHKIFFGQK
jgi:hypothetical protein